MNREGFFACLDRGVDRNFREEDEEYAERRLRREGEESGGVSGEGTAYGGGEQRGNEGEGGDSCVCGGVEGIDVGKAGEDRENCICGGVDGAACTGDDREGCVSIACEAGGVDKRRGTSGGCPSPEDDEDRPVPTCHGAVCEGRVL